jgi:hypothetical protein
VTIRGKGLGGRNQEFALAAAIHIAGLRDVAILSAGTDGTDGPTDASGAIADGTTIARAEAVGLNAAAFLANNDSYHFFEAIGDLIKTGPTGTNVADIQLIFVACSLLVLHLQRRIRRLRWLGRRWRSRGVGRRICLFRARLANRDGSPSGLQPQLRPGAGVPRDG